MLVGWLAQQNLRGQEKTKYPKKKEEHNTKEKKKEEKERKEKIQTRRKREKQDGELTEQVFKDKVSFNTSPPN
jgi:ADP-ribosylglycohydrolase